MMELNTPVIDLENFGALKINLENLKQELIIHNKIIKAWFDLCKQENYPDFVPTNEHPAVAISMTHNDNLLVHVKKIEEF